MEALTLKQVPVKNQKFDAGRTIDIMKCIKCSQEINKCDFLNCNNYAKKMAYEPYSIKEWVEHYKTEFIFSWNADTISALFEKLIIKFPKGLYWDYDKFSHKIRFVEMRYDREIVVAEISMNRYEVFVIDISDTKLKFVNKVCQTIKKINEFV